MFEKMLLSGWLGLLDYLAAHVLLCLIPAFFIAGAISALIPKEIITKLLGSKTSKWISYPVASIGGFLLAVCSCTILPLFAGIWKRGAGLGPAVTFLFAGPAINVLAVAYTGSVIGLDFAVARIVLSVGFSVIIGLIMASVFRKDQEFVNVLANNQQDFLQSKPIKKESLYFFMLFVLILLFGTLQILPLTKTYYSVLINYNIPQNINYFLTIWHVTVQGVMLIALLIITGFFATFGFNKIENGFNFLSLVALFLVILTILIASLNITNTDQIITIGITGKHISEFVTILLLVWMAFTKMSSDDLINLIEETWHFVKQILPLLIVGVFIASMVKPIMPAMWIKTVAGQNTLSANFYATLFGTIMYFPTLVEVPVAKMFMDIGVHKGPLLAYLIADPALSIQSILITAKILGYKRTLTYVALVIIFSTLSGLLYGCFV